MAKVGSGTSGDSLLTFFGAHPGFGKSVSIAADANEDGLEDLLVGAGGLYTGCAVTGEAYVLSASDGAVLLTLASANPESAGTFGYSVSGEANADGSGPPDILVGAPREDGGAVDAGRVYLFSGSDASLVNTLLSPTSEAGGQFGFCLASIGDVNGDGLDDILIGAPYEDGGAVDAGRAYVFSGTGALLATLESPDPEPDGLFGYSLDGLGDTNGDGSPDFAIGAPYEDGGAVDAGRVYVYSGGTVPVELAGFAAVARNGQVLFAWSTLSETETFGFHVYRAGTATQDYARITASIIPGAGTNSVRHDYSYTDATVQPGTCLYKLADVDFGGTQTMHGPVSVTVLPTSFSLLGAHPNPFSETTTLRLNLPQSGHLYVVIHNMAGELVRKLADGEMGAGVQEISWDGRGDAGKSVAPGTYTCRAESDGRMQTAKVVVTK
ncbi:FG-GAP repeat protein [Candidatus Fermentibacteria bacterium]|nr:FG-GAP repeat protein [Candidatus Fermentibacteria bacterium]